MNYRIFPKIPDCQISVLGFGLMRLPLLPNSEEIDKEKTRNLVKLAIEQGINYFDTAYPYHHGKSEIVFGEIVKEDDKLTKEIPQFRMGNEIDELNINQTIFNLSKYSCSLAFPSSLNERL